MPLPPYLMSNFPSVRPSLNLQFDSQPTPEDMTSHLASVGATFSRASIGTYTDANGLIQEASAGQARPNYSSAGVHEGLLIEESRTNVVVNSENFNVYSAIYQTTISAGLEIAPNGKGNSTLVSNTTDNNIHGFAINDGGITSGTVYTLSLFVKKGSSRYFKLKSNNTTTLAIDVTFDLNDGSVDTESFGTGSTQSFSNGWYRLSATGTCGVSGSTSVGIRILNDSKQETYTGVTTENVYVWGLQLEEGSFPTSYIPTIPTFSSRASTATYFDSDGVLQTQAIQTSPTGVGRIDHKYIDGQWVEAGLLLEASATNYIQNQDITTWGKDSGTVVSAESSDSKFPDLDIYSIEDGGGGGDRIYESFNQKSYFSVFVKRKTGTPDIRLQQTSGNVVTYDLTNVTTDSANGEIVDVGDGWFRLLHEDTGSGNGTYQIDLDDQLVGDAVYVTGIQAEDNRWTSFIPIVGGADTTRSADVYTTATKTRSADVCYIDGTAFTDFYNQEQGTILLDAVSPTIGSDTFHAYGIYSATSERIQLQLNNSSTSVAVVDEGVIQANLGDSAISDNTEFKHIFAFKLNDFATVLDGGTPLTDTSGTIPTPSEISIGRSYVGDRYFTGGLKKLIYFPRRLGSVGNNNELIKLTQ